jgi:peptide/nickel transport system substrate-binding protein
MDGPRHLTRPSLITRRQVLRGGLVAAGALGVLGLASSSIASAAPLVRTAAAAAGPAAAQHSGDLVAAGTGDIKFDPYFQIVPLRFVTEQIFNRLVDYFGPDPQTPNPQLADSWVETDQTLTVKLKQGVKFHNGREMVAQDIVDNIARAKDKSIGHYLYDVFNNSVDSADVVDQYTVRLNYSKVYPVKLIDLSKLYIIPKEAMADVATTPVGSGPFKFISYSSGDKLVMQAFDDYWNPPQPYLQSVTVKIIADPQARLANLQSGSVDAVNALALSDAVRLQNDPNLQVSSYPPGGTWYANVLNLAHPPFDNKLVRQALNFSLDRDTINQLAYYSTGPTTQCRYLPNNFWYDPNAASKYTFDLDQAKSLLQQAGLGGGFETSISISESVLPGSQAMAQVWAQNLAQIGITLNIQQKEQGPFYDDYFAGTYDIQAYGLGDGGFDPATEITNSSPMRLANNKANLQLAPFFDDYSKLVLQGTASIDPNVRKPIYDQIQELAADESWVLIMAFWVTFDGVTKRVQGVRKPIDQVISFGNVQLTG